MYVKDWFHVTCTCIYIVQCTVYVYIYIHGTMYNVCFKVWFHVTCIYIVCGVNANFTLPPPSIWWNDDCDDSPRRLSHSTGHLQTHRLSQLFHTTCIIMYNFHMNHLSIIHSTIFTSMRLFWVRRYMYSIHVYSWPHGGVT